MFKRLIKCAAWVLSHPWTVAIVLGIIMTCFTVYLDFKEGYVKFNAGLDDFCKEQGYQQHTETRLSYNRRKIECDGIKIFHVREISYCPPGTADKWGDCDINDLKYKYVINGDAE